MDLLQNFDALDVDDLYTWVDRWDDSRNPDARRLSRYVHPAIAARIARKRGDITAAKIHEDYCDRIFRNLPEHLRW